MSNPYLSILSQQRNYVFVVGALIARTPSAMYGFSIFIMMSILSDDKTLGPFLTATFYLGTSFFAPQVAKLIDKLGQNIVLRWFLLLNAISVFSFLLCVYLHLAQWTLYLTVLALSIMPSVGSLPRARWINLFGKDPKLSTAFALEALCDETVFLIGPPLAIALSSLVFPSAGLWLAWLFLNFGILTMLSHKASEPSISQSSSSKRQTSFALLTKLPLFSLVLFSLVLGITFGTVEIMSVRFAEFKGYTAAIGAVLLIFYSIGSLLSGYIFGLKNRCHSTRQQFFLWATIKSILCILIWFIPNVWLMCAFLFLYGITLAPTITLLLRLVNEAVNPENITEGMSWINSGTNLGSAAGAAMAGWVAAATHLGLGADYGFGISFIAGFVMLILAAVVMKAMKPR